MRGLGLLLLGCVGLAGCSSSKPTSEDPLPTPQLVLNDAALTPSTTIPTTTTASTTLPAEAPPGLAPLPFPGDSAGQLILRTLRGQLDAPPVDKPIVAPRQRVSRVDEGEPSTIGRVSPQLPATPLVKVKTPLPSAPPERLPSDLGAGQHIDPATVKLTPSLPTLRPAPPRTALGAADLPELSRRVDERASFDDPTAELSAQRVINTLLRVPTIELPFLKLTLPDPFELQDQLRGLLGTTEEFGTTPAFVPPRRP